MHESGYDIIATGNTARILRESLLPVIEINEFTQFPEVFSGRVKTLHPKVMGGILMRGENQEDQKEALENNILPIDIVCVNLYPFFEVMNNPGSQHQEIIENIDIGGPSLIRAAAKNYSRVSVLTNPHQYEHFLEELGKGDICIETRKKLAFSAFELTSYYDSLIADYFSSEFNFTSKYIRRNQPLQNSLRYGENPHQKAFLYGNFSSYYELIHGKELSFNNLVDLTAAVDLVNELPPDSCVIVKHTNACGAAIGKNTLDAYLKALSSDPVSAFGSIVAFNTIPDKETAEKMNEIFIEVIVAPDFESDTEKDSTAEKEPQAD